MIIIGVIHDSQSQLFKVNIMSLYKELKIVMHYLFLRCPGLFCPGTLFNRNLFLKFSLFRMLEVIPNLSLAWTFGV
jgi:hypothetical protein